MRVRYNGLGLRGGKSRKALCSKQHLRRILKRSGEKWPGKRVGEHASGSVCWQGGPRGCQKGLRQREVERLGRV